MLNCCWGKIRSYFHTALQINLMLCKRCLLHTRNQLYFSLNVKVYDLGPACCRIFNPTSHAVIIFDDETDISARLKSEVRLCV